MHYPEIIVFQGNITKLKADAIVNAANPSLLGGGGVDGAIHLAAGPQLKEACRALSGCAVGQAKITPGFNLPAAFVIHTVGPIWQGGHCDEAQKLADCYENSLRLAAENNLNSIAFPAISTGVYGYPKDLAARIAVSAIQGFRERKSSLTTIYLVAFDDETAQIFHKLLAE